MKFSVSASLLAFASTAVFAQPLYSNQTITTLSPSSSSSASVFSYSSIPYSHSEIALPNGLYTSVNSDDDTTSTVTLLTTITLDIPTTTFDNTAPTAHANSSDAANSGTRTTPDIFTTASVTTVKTVTPAEGTPYVTTDFHNTVLLATDNNDCPAQETVTVTQYATTQYVTVTTTVHDTESTGPAATAYSSSSNTLEKPVQTPTFVGFYSNSTNQHY
ncbi:Srl1p Ecym_2385 [Eremothecium cymbalariae DBVPG|uniref:Uncharacterized protein n=1 Tax=Eremothecium cymbalariae (strain CBS 270.75 / DBVPG 7215 / KCTC 17166 / NRRL Y-17582) TaxID=931890 RepID=G8JNQ0_ERECY|nr:Hypothetical protein Ecym_2385 [Eremothecium cymbalariae DBVPG\